MVYKVLSAQIPLPLSLAMCVAAFTLGIFRAADLGQPPIPNVIEQHAKKNAFEEVSAKKLVPTIEDDHDDKKFGNTIKPHNNPLPAGESGESGVRAVEFQVLSWSPRAVHYPNFLPEEWCDRIVELAEAKLHPSAVALKKGETLENTKNIRTSQGTFLSAAMDPSGVLQLVEEKIASVTHVHKMQGEAFNVLRYEIGQKYDQHQDIFDPDFYGTQANNRMYSVLLYLSDVVEGGETIFPFEGGVQWATDYKRCDKGLKVKPKKGDALLFYSITPDGQYFDYSALHGGCPVVAGTKWVATKWVHLKSLNRANDEKTFRTLKKPVNGGGRVEPGLP